MNSDPNVESLRPYTLEEVTQLLSNLKIKRFPFIALLRNRFHKGMDYEMAQVQAITEARDSDE